MAAATIVAAMQFAGCASEAPVREATPGGRPQANSDEDNLWYAMQRGETNLQSSPQLVHDAALNAYVRSVACKVAADFCSDLRVYIIEQPQFNAMMAPNGMLIVWTGTLLRVRNEAELAFVLGHEAGHYRAQHVIKQWRRSKDVSAWMSAFQVATFGGGLPVAGELGALAGYAALFKFSREQENEADKLGFTAMVLRGYDPAAARELWARMLREEDTRLYGKTWTVFASHPPTRERLDDVSAAAVATGAHGGERNVAAYRIATRPFLPHWLDMELARREYAASIQVVTELLAEAPAEDHGVLEFYLGEAYRRRADPAGRSEAAHHYAAAVALPGAPPAAWREHGLALRDAGNRSAAANALHRYLELVPDAGDRAFVSRYLAELEGRQP
jgi:predicted Zn-dependent protease